MIELRRSPRGLNFQSLLLHNEFTEPPKAHSVLKDFQKQLRKFASTLCEDTDIKISRYFELSQLQICSKHQSIESYNQSIRCWYQRRKLVCNNIAFDKLFEEARKNALNQSKSFSSAESKNKNIATDGNMLFVAGRAGAGKTTLLKCLIKQMLDSHINLYDVRYVFFLQLHDVDFDKKMSLLEFLVPYSSIDNYTFEDKVTILNHLDTSLGVILLIDGLDEANIDQRLYPSCSVHSITTAATFIKNLLDGNILPHSRKIITSKPEALMLLGSELISRKSIFTIKSNENTIKQVFHNKSLSSPAKLCQQIRSDLRSFNCISSKSILVTRNFSVNTGSLITLTSVIVASLSLWILDNTPQIEIKAISFQEYEQFRKNRFNEEVPEQNLSEWKMVNFATHNIPDLWHKFFVAVRLIFFSHIENFKSMLEKLNSDKDNAMINILFGLCNIATLNDLLEQVVQKDFNSADDRRKSKEVLKNHALKALQNQLINDHLQYLASIFPVLGWLHEMQDDDCTSQVASALKSEIVLHGKLSFAKIKILNYVLYHRKSKLSLNVKRPTLMENCYEYFISELSVTLGQNSNIHLSQLNLVKVDIDANAMRCIAKWIHHMKVLELQNCSIVKENADILEIVTKAIAKKETPILKINFSWNDFCDEGAFYFTQCIHNIEELDLGHCSVSHNAVLLMSQAIANRKCPMKRLSLKGNFLGDEGAKHLADAIHNIQELNLKMCAVHSDGVAALVNQIKDLPNNMQELCLDLCTIGDKGAEHFLDCVGQIIKLSLHGCQISSNMHEILKNHYDKYSF